MDDAAKRALKEKLLRDAEAWDHSVRGFQDIVRNAIDLDKKVARELMKAFDVGYNDLRAWGAGAETPEDYQRYIIVGKIRELLTEELDS